MIALISTSNQNKPSLILGFLCISFHFFYQLLFIHFTLNRENKAPSLFRIKNLVRRFGHAASDRQDQYLTSSTIADVEAYNPLYGYSFFSSPFSSFSCPKILK